MKIGIYISALGKPIDRNSVEKYVERFKNEINFSTNGLQYETKTEKISYTKNRESLVVSIYEKKSPNDIIYKFYDFKYHEILTDNFTNRSLIFKSFWLFTLVISKFPLIIKKVFLPRNYNKSLQSLYVFSIFLILSLSLFLMLPATLEVTFDFFSKHMLELKNSIWNKDIWFLSMSWFDWIKPFSKVIVVFTSLLVAIVPSADLLIKDLATNFICANDYLQHGSQKQLIQGNLEHLVDYISENEKDCEIHFHAYSFGTILALDYIYPYGTKASQNALQYCKAIITIGNPYEFTNSYYSKFYDNRQTQPGDNLQWINIYSIADALATNFRKDGNLGEAEFGIGKALNKPFNINYEVTPVKGIFDFIMLYSIRVHEMYWDNSAEGQSCLGLIYGEMKVRNLI
jgi:hypothetical protein